MDHLMPGMDGLQAVQAIKGNPQTAMIPIMMYTSQEGELYVGQARALGALGVLPKQVRPVDVSKVLYELHLLPDRRDMTEPVLAPVELEGRHPCRESPRGRTGRGRRLGTPGRNGGEGSGGRRAPFHRCKPRQFRLAHRERRAQLHACAAYAGACSRCRPARRVRYGPGRRRSWRQVWSRSAFAASWLVARDDLAKSRAEIAGLTSANTELAARALGSVRIGQRSHRRVGDGLREHGGGRRAVRPGHRGGCSAGRTGAVRRNSLRSRPSRRAARHAGQTRGAGISRGRKDHQPVGTFLPQRQRDGRIRAGGGERIGQQMRCGRQSVRRVL